MSKINFTKEEIEIIIQWTKKRIKEEFRKEEIKFWKESLYFWERKYHERNNK